MMDESTLLATVERYLTGEMPAEERTWFEALRRENAEVDGTVVEHQFFLQELNAVGERKVFVHNLHEVHASLLAEGALKPAPQRTGAKVIQFFDRYKRTAAIAASIAGVTALLISGVFNAAQPDVAPDVITQLGTKLDKAESDNRKQDTALRNIQKNITKDINTPTMPDVVYSPGGTGFLIHTKGFVATKAHVLHKAKNIVVRNSMGLDLRAKAVYVDVARDIAILQIVDTAYKAPASIPYSIRRMSTDIAEPIFTLGFPRNDMVYGEGYLAALTGYNGDTLSLQIAVAANPGNSGGPILNRNGEVIGILSAKQNTAESVVFATQSKYIHQAMEALEKGDTLYNGLKLPLTTALRGVEKTQQVKKIAAFVYMVKVN